MPLLRIIVKARFKYYFKRHDDGKVLLHHSDQIFHTLASDLDLDIIKKVLYISSCFFKNAGIYPNQDKFLSLIET